MPCTRRDRRCGSPTGPRLPIVLRRPTVRLGEMARLQVRSIASAHGAATETGGALFGYESRSGTRVTVTEATDPGDHAFHAPTQFTRDIDHTHRRALEIFESTGAEWVGEWHTHPTGDLRPSTLDVSTYRRHLHDPDLGFRVFVALIVDPHSDCRDAMVWLFSRKRLVGKRTRL